MLFRSARTVSAVLANAGHRNPSLDGVDADAAARPDDDGADAGDGGGTDGDSEEEDQSSLGDF